MCCVLQTSDIDGTFPGILSIFILSAIQLVAVCGVMTFFMPLVGKPRPSASSWF